MILILMSSCTTQGESWNQEANQEYRTKITLSKTCSNAVGNFLQTDGKGFKKKSFNTSSSNHDHKETAIEALTFRIEEGQGKPCWLKFLAQGTASFNL